VPGFRSASRSGVVARIPPSVEDSPFSFRALVKSLDSNDFGHCFNPYTIHPSANCGENSYGEASPHNRAVEGNTSFFRDAGLENPPMNPNGSAAYGMYPRSVALPDVVGALNQAGFDKEDICMVLSPAHPDAEVVNDVSVLEAGGAKRSKSARLIAWFSEFGAVVIPTVGFFIRSEAFFNALLMEQNFPMLSRGSRTLLGLGFSQDDAKRLGHQLCDVSALVYVSCREKKKAEGAIELLRRAGAKEAASLHAAKAIAAAA